MPRRPVWFLCALAVPALAQAQAYSLPWQLRPAGVGNVVRSDTAVASLENPATGDGGSTVATTLLGAYKLTPALAPLVRVGLVRHSPPAGDGATSFVNPVVGGTYVLVPGDLRVALFLGLAVPVGQGGGNTPDAAKAGASAAGVPARSAMDNAMFAVNDFTIFPGVDVAWVKDGLTVQAEATVLELLRVKGEDAQKDAKKTNFTSGLHVGYFVIPELSLGGELRYQRWLTTPAFVDADDTRRETLTFAVGPRGHFALDEGRFLRPGIAYAQGLDDPMSAQSYRIVQLDVPFAF